MEARGKKKHLTLGVYLAGSGLQPEPKHLGSINMIEPAKVIELTVAEGFSLPLCRTGRITQDD